MTFHRNFIEIILITIALYESCLQLFFYCNQFCYILLSLYNIKNLRKSALNPYPIEILSQVFIFRETQFERLHNMLVC